MHAQSQSVTANLSAQDSGACTTPQACLVLVLPANSGSSVVQLSGTFSATVQFEAQSQSGVPWVAINGTPVGGSTAVTSATAPGAWLITASGMYALRARVSTYASGTVVAVLTSSPAAAAVFGIGGATNNPTGQVFNVKAYGAVGNVIQLPTGIGTSGGNCTTGINQLCDNTGTRFTPSMVGQIVDCSTSGGQQMLVRSTVTAFVSTSLLTVSNPRSLSSLNGGNCIFGTDDTAAIQAAFAALLAYSVPNNLPAYISFPTGQYMAFSRLNPGGWCGNSGYGPTCWLRGEGSKIFVPVDFTYPSVNGGAVLDNPDIFGPLTVDGMGSTLTPSGATQGLVKAQNNLWLEVDNWLPPAATPCIYNSTDKIKSFQARSGNCSSALLMAAANTTYTDPYFNCSGTISCAIVFDYGNAILGGLILGTLEVQEQGSEEQYFQLSTTVRNSSQTQAACLFDAGTVSYMIGGSCGPCDGNYCVGAVANANGMKVLAGAEVHLNDAQLTATGTGFPLNNAGTVIVETGLKFYGGFTGSYLTGTAPVMALTHSANTFILPGTIAAASFGNQTPDQTIVITKIQGIDTIGLTTCAVAPVVTFTQGGTTATLTLTTGKQAWDSSVDASTGLPMHLVSGTVFTASTTAGTCVTPPVNLSITYTWQGDITNTGTSP